MAHNLLNSN